MINHQHNRQQGIVLFMALAALVVMSLASVALIRSVDTNTKIAGNLSLKQSALISADRGIESAINWLEQQNIADLNTSLPASGYFADYGDLDNDDIKDSHVGNLDAYQQVTLTDANTWDDFSVVAEGTGINNNGLEMDSRNTIRYIIERMCELEVAPARHTTNKCLFGEVEPGQNSKANFGNGGIGILNIGEFINPIYRVTVRVTGPKNTESYTQVYVY